MKCPTSRIDCETNFYRFWKTFFQSGCIFSGKNISAIVQTFRGSGDAFITCQWPQIVKNKVRYARGKIAPRMTPRSEFQWAALQMLCGLGWCRETPNERFSPGGCSRGASLWVFKVGKYLLRWAVTSPVSIGNAMGNIPSDSSFYRISYRNWTRNRSPK